MADDREGHNTPAGHNERAEHTENPSELGKGQTAGNVSAAQGGSQLWHRKVLVQGEEKGHTTEQLGVANNQPTESLDLKLM